MLFMTHSHLMRILLSALLSVGALHSQAQSDTAFDRSPRRTVFSVGQRIGGSVSMEPGQSGYYSGIPNILQADVGAAVKAALGREQHFALELSAHYGASERTFTGFYDEDFRNYTSFGFRRRSVNAIFQGQYHFGKATQSFRPYLGLGLGATRVWHTTANPDEALYLSYLDGGFGRPEYAVAIQFEQGFTHRLDDSWSLMQATFYRLDDFGRSNFGVRLGFFYAL